MMYPHSIRLAGMMSPQNQVCRHDTSHDQVLRFAISVTASVLQIKGTNGVICEKNDNKMTLKSTYLMEKQLVIISIIFRLEFI